MKLLLCYFIILFLFTGCSPRSITQPSVYSETEGLLISTISKYSNDGIPAFTSPSKIWYHENELIKEIRMVFFNTETNGVQTVREYLTHYAYVNYDAGKFSFYHTFSDTAKSFKTYLKLDSLYEANVGDFFKLSQRPLDSVAAIKPLSDTLIKDVLYQRKRYIQRWKNKDFVSIVYLRCDKPNSKFSIFKNTQDSCSPVIKNDYRGTNNTLDSSTETFFLTDSLTASEKKVFEAWRKQIQ